MAFYKYNMKIALRGWLYGLNSWLHMKNVKNEILLFKWAHSLTPFKHFISGNTAIQKAMCVWER